MKYVGLEQFWNALRVAKVPTHLIGNVNFFPSKNEKNYATGLGEKLDGAKAKIRRIDPVKSSFTLNNGRKINWLSLP